MSIKMNLFEKLFIQYYQISNNKLNLSEKIKLIDDELNLDKEMPLMFIGLISDLLVNEPECYFNKDVKEEIYINLMGLYNRDKDKFIESFYKNQNRFFHSINSYYQILNIYNEFDDVDFDNETKTKIYYLPIITQLMEFCLSHLYKLILYIINDFETKDYTKQTKLGQLKDNLNKFDYKYLIDINIDFRNAISHGNIELYTDKIVLTEKGIELKYYELSEMKNKLLDISSGAILGIIKFISDNNIINPTYLSKIDEKVQYEYLRLFLQNENIKVKSFSKGIIGTTQFNIHLTINNINDTNSIIHLLILVGKIIYMNFSNYERYFISYSHPYSINGMISFEKEQLEKMLFTENISELDKLLTKDSFLLIPPIQNTNVDTRSYKFQIFPRIIGQNWKIKSLRDISIENYKRFEADLIIESKDIMKQEIYNLLFQVTKKIRFLENKNNPITKIKHGKIEADIVRLKVFYKSRSRDFSLLAKNESFVCFVHYYKNEKLPKLTVAFLDNYVYENLKKLDIYWNKNLYDKLG